MNKLSKNRNRMIGVAATCLMLAAWSASSNAQTCTVDNWGGGPTNLTDDNTGTQGQDNRRYAGPCGLRVPVDGTARYLSDDSPAGESTYIARFYAYLDNSGTADVILFAARDDSDDRIQVWKNVPNDGDLTLNVFDQGGGNTFLTVNGADVGSGWKAIEFSWEASASDDNVIFSVSDRSGNFEVVETIDTTGISIETARLGNVNGATGGTIDFDDFDSRRASMPGTLLGGDSNADETINVFDIAAVIDEIQSGIFASGQPDCNADGSINVFDISCQIDIIQN